MLPNQPIAIESAMFDLLEHHGHEVTLATSLPTATCCEIKAAPILFGEETGLLEHVRYLAA